MCTLYIVRHAESVGNAQGFIGAQSTDITSMGESQAHTVAKKLQKTHFDAIYSSHFVRAHRTAQIIARERALAVLTKEALAERSWGHMEGKTRDQLTEQLKQLMESFRELDEHQKWVWKKVPGMESAQEAVARFILFLRELAVAHAGQTVLVVGHGTVMRSLLIHLGWGSVKELPSGSIDNTGFIVLDSDGVDFFVKDTQGVHKKTS